MSAHLLILPVLLPLFTGAILLLVSGARLAWKRPINLIACLALLLVSVLLLVRVTELGTQVYVVGDWVAPFGIVLVLDRLSALMLVITAVLAVPVVIAMSAGTDRTGQNFHGLVQFQLMGLNGAFLTGDLFNLFVFFEILLIASYALLVFGGGRARVAASMHYVILNLFGSALFIIAVGLLYGVTGTLNMADMAVRIATLPAEDVALVRAAGLLLLVVFALKAALLPLGMWLPAAYASAAAPIAALFAIMSKVGLYAIFRVHGLLFGEMAGPLAGLGQSLVWWLALATMLLGILGVLGARDLRTLLAWQVIVSVGTLMAGWSLGTPEAWSAALFYMVHSTWMTAALFLIAGVVVARRGEAKDSFMVDARVASSLVGLAFIAGAVALAGLPPLSGFVGKALLLQAAGFSSDMTVFWVLMLCGGLAGLLAFSRAGTSLFWRGPIAEASADEPAMPLTPALLLLAMSVLLVAAGGPILDYLMATAEAMLQPAEMIRAVLGDHYLPGGA